MSNKTITNLLAKDLKDLNSTEMRIISDHFKQLESNKNQFDYEEFYLDVFQRNKFTTEKLKADPKLKTLFLQEFNKYFIANSYLYKGNKERNVSSAKTLSSHLIASAITEDIIFENLSYVYDQFESSYIVVKLDNTDIYLASKHETSSYDNTPIVWGWVLVDVKQKLINVATEI